MATLTITHYIYLTNEQRYNLHFGENIEVIGVCVPVWFHRGTTSEPAQEIFCKYLIKNEKPGNAISLLEEGFSINLPQNKEGLSQDLLDIKDDGKEKLVFRQYNKFFKGPHKMNIVHFIEIKSDELLKETLS